MGICIVWQLAAWDTCTHIGMRATLLLFQLPADMHPAGGSKWRVNYQVPSAHMGEVGRVIHLGPEPRLSQAFGKWTCMLEILISFFFSIQWQYRKTSKSCNGFSSSSGKSQNVNNGLESSTWSALGLHHKLLPSSSLLLLFPHLFNPMQPH